MEELGAGATNEEPCTGDPPWPPRFPTPCSAFSKEFLAPVRPPGWSDALSSLLSRNSKNFTEFLALITAYFPRGSTIFTPYSSLLTGFMTLPIAAVSRSHLDVSANNCLRPVLVRR